MKIGTTVLYRLSEVDAEQINRRRTTGSAIAEQIGKDRWPLGAQAHIGNNVAAGQQYPMVITRTWTETTVNGQVLLDGTDVFWATSRVQGDQPGTWSEVAS